MDDTLNKFFLATQNLRDSMEDDMELDGAAQLRLENYLALLQMTYIEWKRRNVPPTYWRGSFSDLQGEATSQPRTDRKPLRTV